MTRVSPIAWVILLYLALSLAYNAASPIFEAPDEATHFRYAKYLLDHRTLPAIIDGPNRDELWGLHQPPLYFALEALLAAPFTLQHPDEYLARNPHVNMGVATVPGNKNVFRHTPAEAFPWRGFPLAIRVLRLLSTALGALTLWVVYRIGLNLFSGQRGAAIIAPTLMALHPEFVFITSAIHNEPLNILLMSLGLWGALRLIAQGPSLKLALGLGVVSGAIIITKMTGLALILIIVLAMLIAALRGHNARGLWGFGVVVAGLMAVLGGWWYLFNQHLYGDPFQAGMYRDFYGDVQRGLTLGQWWRGILRGEVSFWGTFGWFNILLPEWMYTIYGWLARIGLLGVGVYLGRWILHRREDLRPTTPWSLVLLIALPLTSALVLARLIATEGGIQGRQLLPMLPALALLLAIGYRSLLPSRIRPWVLGGVAALLLTMTAAIPFGIIAPAYAAPPTVAGLPAQATPLVRHYENGITLHGYQLDKPVAYPGETIHLTLYWQADQALSENYTIFVHGLGRNLAKIGEYNGDAGLGNLPVSQWQPGIIYADTYPIVINAAADTPTLLRLHLGLFDYTSPETAPLTVVDENGATVSTHVAEIPLLTGTAQAVTLPVDCSTQNITFGNEITLQCSQLATDSLTLVWKAENKPAANYTVFVQLWRNGEQIAGFDAPPLAGDFPSGYWPAGLTVVDERPLDLSAVPPGDYQVRVGLYQPQSGVRLPAVNAQGQTQPDGAVNVGSLTRD